MSKTRTCSGCEKQIPTRARVCPFCSTRTSRRRWWPWVVGVLAAPFVLGWWNLQQMSPQERAAFDAQREARAQARAQERAAEQAAKAAREQARRERRCEDGSEALPQSRPYARAAVAPRSAQFPSGSGRAFYLGECRHWVTGPLDTVNAFNAPVQLWYGVRMRYDPADDRWHGSTAKVGTQEAIAAATLVQAQSAQ